MTESNEEQRKSDGAMKSTILLAGAFALAVLAFFAGLQFGAGRMLSGPAAKPQHAGAPPETLVPPLDKITKEQEDERQKKEAFHTKAEPPTIHIFQTLYKGGTQVTFNHTKHVETYKLSCIECHHVERCSKCHLKNETHTMEVAKGKQAFHENCIGCHADRAGPEECAGCHKQ